MEVTLPEPDQLYNSSPSKKSLYAKLNSSVVWAKIFRWEFWPFSVFYFPVLFYWLWSTIRARSIFFFTASNPGIEFGGMLGESKMKIFDLIPAQYIPKTFRLTPDVSSTELLMHVKDRGMDFPFILKPDIGERGWMVELIKSEEQLNRYLEDIQVDFLVQEFVPYEVELGVFYYHYPDQPRGTVSSIVMKDMLKVVGDGVQTVEQLMQQDARAKMHLQRLWLKEPIKLRHIPSRGEIVELVSIGNHCLGTTFLNGNHLINDKLIAVFDRVSQQIEGFYFGRYDLRCRSLDDLYRGEYFKVLELNGAGAEPAHIYHPGFSLIQAYKDIIHHLQVLTDISILNRKRGIPYMGFFEGLREVRKIRKYNREKVK
ncbi:hypothetical protein N6H18_03385 [Reichenbachiella agarivorans]|uniref:ATP-grasp domain-containing protein n=1 Tax=Reichenbachiella agarivorans TaxID=2979464 RepID=A0ABY6CUG5_9BACT|nr:hypothetical protein [Reichenbachiella agarivorans]UXP32998.1 hypothetical protein N6H18_03385 [Reichenbachiella agarivorans]